MYRLLFEDRAAHRAPFVSNKTTVVVGRDAACELRLTDPGVRARHAAIERRTDGYYLRDIGQANAVHVNGQVITEQRLATGDEVELGAVRLRFEVVHDPPPGRRAFDPLLLLAALVVVALVGAQVGLFGWVFSTPHPRNMRTDASKAPRSTVNPVAIESLATPLSLLPATAEAPLTPAPAAVPPVLNRMLKIVRVERLDAPESVTLRISVKAQVGERRLDVAATAIAVQFLTAGAAPRDVIWLTGPRDWENFSTKQFSARFAGAPAQCAGYEVRTYYRKLLQDVAAAPALTAP